MRMAEIYAAISLCAKCGAVGKYWPQRATRSYTCLHGLRAVDEDRARPSAGDTAPSSLMDRTFLLSSIWRSAAPGLQHMDVGVAGPSIYSRSFMGSML